MTTTVTASAGQTSVATKDLSLGDKLVFTATATAYLEMASSVSDVAAGVSSWVTALSGSGTVYATKGGSAFRVRCVTGTCSATQTDGDVSTFVEAGYTGSALFVVSPFLSNSATVSLTSGVGAASANTAAIQAALDAGGYVLLPAGTYYINSPVRISSNTKLSGSGGGTRLKLAPNSHCNLLTTKAYADLGTTVTVTWTSGQTASVAWTSHPFSSVGDYCCLIRANQSAFVGAFMVIGVTDANNFVIQLTETPTGVATGTIIGRKATVNFDIDHITFDYDWANNSSGASDDSSLHAVILAFAQRFTMKRCQFSHVPKYCVTLGAVRDYYVEHMHALDGDEVAGAKTGDVIKVYGPSMNGETSFITGRCGDDGISLQPEEVAAFSQYDFTGGSIIGHKIAHMGVDDTSTTAIALYPCDNALHPWLLSNIEIDGVYGYSNNQRIKVAGDTNAADYGCLIGDVLIRNFRPIGYPSISRLFDFDRKCYAQKFKFEALAISDPGITSGIDSMRVMGKIDALQIEGAIKGAQSLFTTQSPCLIDVLDFSSLKAENLVAVYCPNGGAINTVNFRSCSLTKSSGGAPNFVYPLSSTTIKDINFFGCNTDSNCAAYVETESGALTGCKVSIFGGVVGGNKCLGASNNMDLYVAGATFSNVSNGVLRTTGNVTCSFWSGGGNSFSSSPAVTVVSGTPAISVYGFDLSIGIAGTGIARTSGAFCKASANTGSGGASDILANNLVVCDATNAAGSWKQLSAPTTRSY